MFSSARLKIHLKLCINRVKLLRAKKENLSLLARKEISNLLLDGKIESAKIRVEGIIRQDDFCEALEILELYCELILARFGLLELNGELDSSLIEAIHSMIYCSTRCSEVKELIMIRDQLALKFGKEYVMKAMQDQDLLVSPNLVHKLQVTPPNPTLVDKYIEEIGIRYQVPGYGEVEMIEEGQEINTEKEKDDIDLLIPSPPQNKVEPIKKVDNVTTKKSNTNIVQPKTNAPSKNGVPTLSELEARFLALKKGS